MTSNRDLKNVEIFKYLAPEEAAAVLADAREVTLGQGEILFEAGSVGNELFIIKSGRIKVFRVFDGNEISFAEFGTGDAFGEMSLIDEYPRSASVAALEDCVLLSLDRPSFKNLLGKNPDVGVKLLLGLAEVFSKRMRKTDKLLETYHLVNKALITNEEFRQLYTAIHA
ncbi:MAG: cyclic nucleotide-binding domain-containing protein [Candidatus Coatesbacteria bacterium]|nr:MAG: cyclic nucleotide-binding domain-containing protein [Candidatus Coatesbacteria bacterium]